MSCSGCLVAAALLVCGAVLLYKEMGQKPESWNPTGRVVGWRTSTMWLDDDYYYVSTFQVSEDGNNLILINEKVKVYDPGEFQLSFGTSAEYVVALIHQYKLAVYCLDIVLVSVEKAPIPAPFVTLNTEANISYQQSIYSTDEERRHSIGQYYKENLRK